MFLKKSTTASKSVGSVAGSVGKLFDEIAAVSQQKRLTAHFGDVQIVLDVGNRELLKVVSVLPESFDQSQVMDIAARDDDNLQEQLDSLGLFFAALAEINDSFALNSSLVPLRYSSKLQGFSKDELTIAVLSNLRPVAPAASSEPAQTEASPAVEKPLPTAEAVLVPDLRFFKQMAAKCDAAIVMDWTGAILEQSGELALFEGLADPILADMSQWIMNTHERVSPRQFIVLRGSDATQLGVCIKTEPASITVVAFSATSTGRVFSAVSSYAD